MINTTSIPELLYMDQFYSSKDHFYGKQNKAVTDNKNVNTHLNIQKKNGIQNSCS